MIKKEVKVIFRKILRIVYFCHIVLVLIILLFCGFYALFNPKIGTLMIYRKYNNHFEVKPVHFVPLSKIPKPVITMVLAAEDHNFYGHWGIDTEAIQEALAKKNNLKKKYYGGSTITQQLARTLFLIPEKTYVRKYFEIIIAVEMDMLMQKDRILELYLNSIEWGKGIFGIQNASYYYFNKNLDELSLDEMIKLITIMPSPVKYNPDNFNDLKALSVRYEFLNQVMGLTNASLPTSFLSDHPVDVL